MERSHFPVDFSDIYLESIYSNLYLSLSLSRDGRAFQSSCQGLSGILLLFLSRMLAGRGDSSSQSLAAECAWHSPAPLLCCRIPFWERRAAEASACCAGARGGTQAGLGASTALWEGRRLEVTAPASGAAVVLRRWMQQLGRLRPPLPTEFLPAASAFCMRVKILSCWNWESVDQWYKHP